MAGSREELLRGAYQNLFSAMPVINEWLNTHVRLCGELSACPSCKQDHERLAATQLALIDAGGDKDLLANVQQGSSDIGLRLTYVGKPSDPNSDILVSRKEWAKLMRMNLLIVVGQRSNVKRLLATSLACSCLVPALLVDESGITVYWPGGACPYCHSQLDLASSIYIEQASHPSRKQFLIGLLFHLIKKCLSNFQRGH